MRNGSTAAELVRSASVVISAGPSEQGTEPLGSGFLVRQGRVLTCAHVVRQRTDLWVEWHGRTVPATVLGRDPAAPPATGAVDFPDAAVLAVPDLGVHPTVSLTQDRPAAGADLYVYAISKVRTGFAEPDSSLLKYAGPVADDQRYLKLVRGKIAPGQSGGPVLNLDTGFVCGMVKQTLATTAENEGGIAVPIVDALAVVADDIFAANLAEHDGTVEALRREQAALDPLPEGVIGAVKSSRAAPSLAAALLRVGVVPPNDESRNDPEWVARQLFRLTLQDLVVVLENAGAVPANAAADILWRVACCVPADDGPQSWWVPAEAALTIRSEWQADVPRVVAFPSSYPDTGRHLASRALCQRAVRVELPDISADTDPDGLPGGIADAIGRTLQHALNVPERRWTNNRAESIASARKFGRVVVLQPTLLGDPDFLRALLSAYGGLFYMGGSRDTEPADVPELVVRVQPLIDEDVEDAADQALTTLTLGGG